MSGRRPHSDRAGESPLRHLAADFSNPVAVFGVVLWRSSCCWRSSAPLVSPQDPYDSAS